MDAILKIQNVVKSYHNHIAVDDVSFEMERGSIFGMLGPNGAGKTSLIRVITTITGADKGQVLFDGERLNRSHPRLIGYMPEERGLYKKMKVGDHLIYLARLKGLTKNDAKEKIDNWLQKFGIEDWWNKKVDELSKGMQQKIQFIATVMHEPKLLILDEPFSGLDPLNANLIKDEIYELQQKGTSIIFSTHRMEQVEQICDRIVLINQGKNILEGRVEDIKQSYKDNIFNLKYKGQLPEEVEQLGLILDTKPNALSIQLKEEKDANTLLKIFIDRNIQIVSFNEELPSLDEIFIKKVEQIQ